MASGASPERYRFGAFELHLDERRLLKDGLPVSLRPRAFDLLAAMVDQAGHLISKDALLDRVWPGLVVEEAALHVQVSALRKVLGDGAITTVSGRGYQFTLPVTKRDGQAGHPSKPKHNLPYQLTTFVGREQETAQLKEVVTAHRLVTLTGAGGAGKTRLAIELANRMVDTYPDGVWLVELAALTDPGLVPQAVAQPLGVKEHATQPMIESLSDYLASRKLLLVLDNAEHLLDACAHLVDEIVRRSPDIAVLVTSRERLGITGELAYRVPSLTVPGTSEPPTPETVSRYEGVRLFVERAKLARLDFDLTAENASCVASICARLDGMPLPIELAAARVRSMSVDELSEHLDQRFALLTDGSRAALPRHRTLRSLLDWSYDLLTEREQAMLRRVAVFVGGWTLASAEQVCAGDGIDASDVIERLASLVDKSLVVTDEQAGTTRYRMLETVRQYALDRLRESSEEARWRGRHLTHFLALGEAFYAELSTPKQRSWLSRLTAEHDNVRAALGWSVESTPMEGLRLATAFNLFWRIRGHLAEGRDWLTRLLAAVPIEPRTRERANGQFVTGLLALAQGDHLAAERLFQGTLAFYREIDDQSRVAWALGGLGILSIGQGHYAEAEAFLRESVDRARATANRRTLFASLGNLGLVKQTQGQRAAARELQEEALEVARELDAPWEIGWGLNELGWAEYNEERWDLAHMRFAEGITLLHGVGDRPGVIVALEGLAALAGATAPERAARLWGAADGLREQIGNARSVPDNIVYDHHAKQVRAVLTAEASNQAWNEGRAMSMDDAVRYALEDKAIPDA